MPTSVSNETARTLELFANDAAVIHRPRRTARPSAQARHTPEQSPHAHTGFQLGRDYARHGLTPPAPHALEATAVRQGWLAGQVVFGGRTLAATEPAAQWLALRLHAWQQRRVVELHHITPLYLQQLATTHCPITRHRLGNAEQPHTGAVFNPVRSDASYAAGNVVVMSAGAQHAKAALRFDDALHIARRLDAAHARGGASCATQGTDALTAAQWGRLAVLCSYVEPLPHVQACELPMLVLPPNRLRLFNPVQALQAVVSQQWFTAGWSQRINTLETLIAGAPARRAFRSFFQAWLPRVIEAGGRSADAQQVRWAVEDAWGSATVMQRWIRFAQPLGATQCEALVQRAAAAGLLRKGLRIDLLTDAVATDGWCLDTHGTAPPAASAGSPTAAPREACPGMPHKNIPKTSSNPMPSITPGPTVKAALTTTPESAPHARPDTSLDNLPPPLPGQPTRAHTQRLH